MTEIEQTYQQCIDSGQSISECVKKSASKVTGKLKPEDDTWAARGGKRRRKSRRKTKSKRARKSLAPKAHMNGTRSSCRY
jgi:hypothetical protein